MWSSFRLPLLWEAKRTPSRIPQFAARDELRERLSRWNLADGDHLTARFTTLDAGSFDCENVLFYNIGSGPFSKLLRNRLRFSRRWSSPPPSPQGAEFDYLVEYEKRRFEPVSHPDFGTTVEFPWKIGRSITPEKVWWLATSAAAANVRPIAGRFAVHATIGSNEQIRLTVDRMKKLLDGLVASCHADADPSGDAIERLAARNRWLPQTVELRLRRPPNPVLGPRALYRQSWNPADDRCDECEIEVVECKAPYCRFTISEIAPD